MITPEAKTFVTHDGRQFTFLFDIDGLIAVEDCANGPDGIANLLQIFRGAMNKRTGYLRAMVYGGLKACQPAITRAEAMELIQSDGPALGAALWPAFFSALPKPEAEPGENPPKGARPGGTGTRSSRRGSKKGSTKPASASRRRAATR